jgi:hypothetical protein
MSGLPEQTDRQQCVERAHVTARGLARPPLHATNSTGRRAWGQSAAGGARRWRTRERTAATLIVAFWRPAPTIQEGSMSCGANANRIAAARQPWLGTPAVARHEQRRPAGARAERGGRSEKVAHLRGTERTAAPLIAPIAPVFGQDGESAQPSRRRLLKNSVAVRRW